MSAELGNGYENHRAGATAAYHIDWSRAAEGAATSSGYLQPGESITASTWTIEAGKSVVKVSDDFGLQLTTIVVAGGVARTRVTLTNHIVTSDGREEFATITLLVGA